MSRKRHGCVLAPKLAPLPCDSDDYSNSTSTHVVAVGREVRQHRSWRLAQAAEEAGGYGYSSPVQLAVPRKLRGHPIECIDVIKLPIGIADGYEIVSASGTKDYRSGDYERPEGAPGFWSDLEAESTAQASDRDRYMAQEKAAQKAHLE